jgi:hypothetical protein
MIFSPRVNTFDFGTAKRRRVSLGKRYAPSWSVLSLLGFKWVCPDFFPWGVDGAANRKNPSFSNFHNLKRLIKKSLQLFEFICKPFMFI